MDKLSSCACFQLRGELTCSRFRWRASSLVDAADNSFGLGLGRGAGIDISISEASETPSSGPKSMGSSRSSPRAFPFPFMVPFAGFGWWMLDLRWDCFEPDGAGTSSLSAMMIGSALPCTLSSGLT